MAWIATTTLAEPTAPTGDMLPAGALVRSHMPGPCYSACLAQFQLRPEERVLRERFGAEFERYAASVRRWI